MKFKVIKGCVITGDVYKVGDVVELTDTETAKMLMGIKRIEPFTEEEKPKVENRSVGLEVSEDRPKRRGRKPKVEVDDS